MLEEPQDSVVGREVVSGGAGRCEVREGQRQGGLIGPGKDFVVYSKCGGSRGWSEAEGLGI